MERRILVVGIVALGLAACGGMPKETTPATPASVASTPSGNQAGRATAASPLQLIIKFRNPGTDPSAPGFLAQLSATAGETLFYVRPMSGDAHVFSVARPMTNAEKQALIRKLSARPDVEYAEEDSVMTIQ